LHAALTRKGGVHELLNQPARWELLLRTVQAELTQARRLMAGAEGNLDSEITQRLAGVGQQLAGGPGEFPPGLRLEPIRPDRATSVKVGIDYETSAQEYPRVFAGFGALTQDPEAVATRVAASPIKEQLVAALDDWAWVTFRFKRKDLAGKLLAVTRRVAPDA